MGKTLKIASDKELRQFLPYEGLVEVLRNAFRSEVNVPLRHHHNYPNPGVQRESTLLLMPAWDAGQYFGVKMVTISPENAATYQLPSIQGLYTLFDTATGTPILQCDARLLTALRTAAASALAASYLAREDSQRLLMIGTGTLAPHLIRAHAAVRPIREVYVWGRNLEKAQLVAKELGGASFSVQAVEQLADYIPQADIISCATMTTDPLLMGEYLREGQHIDLVGSYRPEMREADDQVILRSDVYVDTLEGACKETGDILIPLTSGLLREKDIAGDLFSMCRQSKLFLRDSDQSITCFKSVGHALEDLAAAVKVYEGFTQPIAKKKKPQG